MTHDYIIIGGGIAGLSALHHLKLAGRDAVLIEQNSRVGGHIHTINENGFLFETGPNTFLSSSAPLTLLANELDLANELLTPEAAVGKRRFIYRKDRLHLVPAGPHLLLSPLLSLRGRLRIMAEPFIGRAKNNDEETVASFITRRLGKEVLNTLVDPFISGIYAGNPNTLSINSLWPKMVTLERDHGGIFRGMRHIKGELKSGTLCSFKGGLGALTNRLHERYKDFIIGSSRVDEIKNVGDKYLISFCNINDGKKCEATASKILIATPAHTTGQLLKNIAPQADTILREIPYVPLAVVHTVFGSAAANKPLNGFGFLIPRSEKIRMLGSIWSSSLFDGRAPNGNMLLTNFIGGATDCKIQDLTDLEIEKVILSDLRRTLGITAKPVLTKITRHEKAISQFTLGHGKRIEDLTNTTKHYSGLHLTGSYFTGISIADTIEHARNTADRSLKS